MENILSLPTRIEKKINKTSTCWLWTGCILKNGYGQTYLDGRREYAHRAIYTILKGRIPENYTIDHLCFVRNCVNPEHLEPVTLKVNLKRAPRWLGNRTHCPKGHEYTETNTIKSKDARKCRECKRDWDRRYYQKKKLS